MKKIKFIGNTQSNYAFKIPGKQENYGKQRSRLGMVGHDIKKGAALGARVKGTLDAGQGMINGLKLGKSLPSKIGLAALGTAFGGIGGTVDGVVKGALVGGAVGTGRAVLTPRKKRTTLGKAKTGLYKAIDSYRNDK